MGTQGGLLTRLLYSLRPAPKDRRPEPHCQANSGSGGSSACGAGPLARASSCSASGSALSGQGSSSNAGGAGSIGGLTCEALSGLKGTLPRSSPAAGIQTRPEPDVLLWRRFNLHSHLTELPPRLRSVALFKYQLVGRPSNDVSLGLEGWRSGALRRWALRFPVLTVIDAPGAAREGEGFLEWPLFDIFKIPLAGMGGWVDYLATLRRKDRWNVQQRVKSFASFEASGQLTCRRVLLGPAAFARPGKNPPSSASSASSSASPNLPTPHPELHSTGAEGSGDPPFPLPPAVAPPTPMRAEALLASMWALYEQTGRRNGFVEVDRAQFELLVRRAPGIQAVVVREGGEAGRLLAFGLLLPQRESLQVLYVGMQYDSPLVRQSNAYFQILLVGVLLAIVHNTAVRAHMAAAAAASGSLRGSSGGAPSDLAPAGSADGDATQRPRSPPSPHLLDAAASPTAGAAPDMVAGGEWPLGAPGQLLEFVDLGPGHRFVKEHLGAVGHPLSMYTRGIGPIAQATSRRLLKKHFAPKAYLKDP
ncbi:hypothetical protein HYH03_005630 [Edaphochlamys debaryana]|uniref:Uncharacterized protein n=1 Tax=Edaphochlamys debaryana TaxID=47281 RepID=A0A835Y7X2_9CHLO|nr:hypothetical protein HYH03_005630 [Edaphochlamys debaryana]|eukprot:KAG2496403.1 hypothetical protein HYH03_005630 [Edaphochlamys debaryana]